MQLSKESCDEIPYVPTQWVPIPPKDTREDIVAIRKEIQRLKENEKNSSIPRRVAQWQKKAVAIEEALTLALDKEVEDAYEDFDVITALALRESPVCALARNPLFQEDREDVKRIRGEIRRLEESEIRERERDEESDLLWEWSWKIRRLKGTLEEALSFEVEDVLQDSDVVEALAMKEPCLTPENIKPVSIFLQLVYILN